MGTTTAEPGKSDKLLAKVLLTCAVEFPFFGVLLFGGAGTLAWTAAWVWIGISMVITIPMVIFLYKHDPDLLQERLRAPIQKNQKSWDKVLLSIFLTLFLLWLPLMACDAVRFQWSHMQSWLAVLGALLVVASNLFICWCFVENSYLAPVVKIQTERGHQVVSKGPYAIVRHPMYAGALFYIIGTALLFGSYCGLVLGLVMNALLVIRTALEDRTLQEELPGYAEYAGKVRYRLFPGMW